MIFLLSPDFPRIYRIFFWEILKMHQTIKQNGDVRERGEEFEKKVKVWTVLVNEETIKA